MHFISYKAGILAIVAAVLLGFHKTDRVIDVLKDRSQLSLPLTDKKLVIAHCMTNIIRYKGHKLEDSCDPAFYSPDSNISAPLGGLTQVKVMADEYLSSASLDEAVEFELRAAIQSGIDGFQFYYTLGNDSWDEIIRAYFRVVKAKNIDFKFTFCISHPSGTNEETRIADFARRMNSILDEVGRNDPHWFRTPDGRLIIYTWYGDSLADIPADLKGLPAQYYIANAFTKLENAVQEKFACIISINEQISKDKLNHYLDYFPAVWLWTLPFTDHYIGNMVAAECKKRKRVFTGSTFPDFYTSKLLKKGSWDMFHFAADAVKAGIAQTERKYIVTGLSYNFRKQFEFAIDNDVPVMNIITWNDYPEGHHLAPEINHNDGFSILLQYYKSVWKNQSSPYAGKDIVVAFYKKYNHSTTPSPYNIPVVEIEKAGVPVKYEDSIEVVSILKERGDIVVGGKKRTVDAGLQAVKFAPVAGAVEVSLQRNNNEVEKLVCPEWRTDKPYRTDRLTYTFSNQSASFYKTLFGGHTLLYSEEYNPAARNNKIQSYNRESTR